MSYFASHNCTDVSGNKIGELVVNRLMHKLLNKFRVTFYLTNNLAILLA